MAISTLDQRWKTLTSGDGHIDDDGPTHQQMVDAWTWGVERYGSSRNQILDARDLETGDLYLASPDAVIKNGVVESDPYARRLPQRWLLPLYQEQTLSAQMPDYLREALTGSERADMQAQEVEAWMRGTRAQVLPWTDGCGKVVRDGQFAAFMLPMSAAWDLQPSYMDTVSKSVSREWWRDTDNRPTSDEKKRDRKNSAKAYREELERWHAGRVPFAHRLVSATDCVPFFTRGVGKRRYELRALLVRTLHDRFSLFEDGFRWEGMRDMILPTGFDARAVHGAGGQLYLYEWLYYRTLTLEDGLIDRIPYVAYSVAGVETWHNRMSPQRDAVDRAPAVVNLRERYGMRRHLMGYYYGWHRAGEDDPGKAGIPIMTPVMDMILGTESLWSSTEKHARASAFCGYQYIPSKDTIAGSYTHGTQGQNAADPPPLPGSGEAIAVDGEYKPIAPAPLGPEVRYLIELGLAQLQLNSPDPQLHGGSGDDPGYKVSLLHALQQQANTHMRDGLREWVEDVGEWSLELAGALIRHFKLDGIPVEENLPPTIDTSARRTPRKAINLTETMLGGRYHVTAFYPSVGSIPEVQQISELYDKHQASWDDLMEARGKNDAMGELVKITAHWALVGTPEGQNDLRVWIARYRGDEEQAKALIEQGMLTPDGSTTAEITPEAMAAAQGAVGRMGGGGGFPAGAASMGGIMSGATQGASIQRAGIAESAVGAPAGAGAGAVGL